MTSLYHEKQLSSLCGVHALNNMLQGPYFGAGDLAQLALALADGLVEARDLGLDLVGRDVPLRRRDAATVEPVGAADGDAG